MVRYASLLDFFSGLVSQTFSGALVPALLTLGSEITSLLSFPRDFFAVPGFLGLLVDDYGSSGALLKILRLASRDFDNFCFA